MQQVVKRRVRIRSGIEAPGFCLPHQVAPGISNAMPLSSQIPPLP